MVITTAIFNVKNMESQFESSIFDLQIDDEASGYLTEIAKWSKFFAILGFIGGVFITLAGLVTAFLSSSLDSFAGLRGMGPAVGIFFVILSAAYLYPSWLLLKFATNMPTGLKKNDQLLVNDAFKNLKTCFRFWGVLTLIIIGLYVLVFIAGLIGQAAQ